MVVSIVVPVFRNAQTIHELYHQVDELFKERNDVELELYFIDDGSDDDSLEKILIITSQDVRVRYLSFDKNYGQVAAIVAGLRVCSGDAAVVMSADLQDPIAKIEEMIECWKRGASIVICYRKSREDKWLDRFFSSVFYGLIKLIYPSIPHGGFDYFLLNRSCIDEFNEIDRVGRFLQGDVVKLNGNKVFLSYARLARAFGKSQWTFSRKVNYAKVALFYQDRVARILGACFFLLGCISIALSHYKIGLVFFLSLIWIVFIAYRSKKQQRNRKIQLYYRVERQS